MVEIGISLYLGTGYEKNKEIILKARKANVRYAFTSLHIPEETIDNVQLEVEKLVGFCKLNDLDLFLDISPLTLANIGVASFEELRQKNITHIRLDYGFSITDIVNLSKLFHIVLNASTLENAFLMKLANEGIDFTKVTACHNYYPKPLTALSIDKV